MLASSFSGLFTRVEIGHIFMRSDGYGTQQVAWIGSKGIEGFRLS
jgi:hypothetical protein